jgi:hypothetical protein
MSAAPTADVRSDGEGAAGYDADGDGHYKAADEGGRGVGEDQLQSDPDDNQRPEAPGVHEDGRGDGVPVIGEGYATQND